MRFLSETDMNFLEMIDLCEVKFSSVVEVVYQHYKTTYFKGAFKKLRDNYSAGSNLFDRCTFRYLLLNLREELIERIMHSQFSFQCNCDDLFLSCKCLLFERNPLISNLARTKTSFTNQSKYLVSVLEREKK